MIWKKKSAIRSEQLMCHHTTTRDQHMRTTTTHSHTRACSQTTGKPFMQNTYIHHVNVK